MSFELLSMTASDIPTFKTDIQEAFQKGFEDVYGKTDGTILPEKDIDRSLNEQGSVAYKAIVDGEPIPEAGVPEAFRAMVKELQGLGLSIKLIDKDGKNVVNESLVDQFAEAQASKRGL